MKKLIFTLWLIIGSSSLLSAQEPEDIVVLMPLDTWDLQIIKEKPVNTLYAVFQPTDLGVGLRFDHRYQTKGLYASLSYGNYKFFGGYLKDHVKLSFGGIAYLDNTFVSMGVSCNSYGSRRFPEGMDELTTQMFSSEVGIGAILGRMTVAVRFDFGKWESNIDIGINFGKK